jgi:protein SCO1/2
VTIEGSPAVPVRRTSPRLPWAAALLGGLLFAPSAGVAEEAQAGGSGHEHCHPVGSTTAAPAGAAEAGSGGARYARSERAYAIPDVTLVDEAGRPVRLRELLAADEPVMLNFIFTTCTAICPVMSRIFARVPAELGAEAGRVRLISISIDPEHDTPRQLRAYADRFGAGERWRFLTGRLEDIVAVERAFDAYRGDKMNHQPLTLLRPRPDRPWVRLDGFASPAQLAQEYERVARR